MNDDDSSSNKKALTNTTCIQNTNSDYFESLIANNLIQWTKSHHRAYGISTSLYESNPVTKQTVGEPIADTFAILSRSNNSLLLMADGVNWGVRSRRASRCAVRAALNYINKYLFFDFNNNNLNGSNSASNTAASATATGNNSTNSSNGSCGSGNASHIKTTHDLFKIMSKAFDEAQECIIKKEGTMTTLCCSIVVKLKESSSNHNNANAKENCNNEPIMTTSSSSMYVVCTLSIGDSTAYVFNREKGVFELTKGSRNTNNDRDMRDVGGALGYVYGKKPDLSNINYSIMYIKSNDIVFLVSDGISDNFDPAISGVARKRKTQQQNTTSNNQNPNVLNEQLPEMDPYERYLCSLNHMNEVLNRNRTLSDTISAQELCAMLIEHVVKLTEQKRQLLENGFYQLSTIKSDEEKLKFQMKLREDALKLHGKLDHASVVAFEAF